MQRRPFCSGAMCRSRRDRESGTTGPRERLSAPYDKEALSMIHHGNARPLRIVSLLSLLTIAGLLLWLNQPRDIAISR